MLLRVAEALRRHLFFLLWRAAEALRRHLLFFCCCEQQRHCGVTFFFFCCCEQQRRCGVTFFFVLLRAAEALGPHLLFSAFASSGVAAPPSFFLLLRAAEVFVPELHLLFSACTLDVTSTMMTRMHVRSSIRAHSPLSGSSVNESRAQDTEQKHGKHGSGALLSFLSSAPCCGCSLSTVVACPLWSRSWVANLERARSSSERVWRLVGCVSGTSAKLVGTSVRLVAGCRWNE